MKTNRVVQIANLTISERKNSNTFRVYSVVGLAPTINTMGGGNREPLIPVIYESDKLRKPGKEQRRLEEGKPQADAGDEL